MITVRIPLENQPYDAHVGDGLLREAGALAASVIRPQKCAIITDSRVRPLYADQLAGSLKHAGFSPDVFVVPAGEKSKSMAEATSLCDRMIASGLDRGSCVFALGGGVVGDLSGFVAAIYYRGIPYVQIPTTVVAQVDSSVGGKTGVNAPGGKNLIGAFHQPRLVIADTATLSTLPPREFNEGFAEIIKHAAIKDISLLDAADDLPALIARNIAIKAEIVAKDEKETEGLRALLNFGHTVGHGIENAAGYGRFLHGEAIALGLVAACRLSVEKAGLAQKDCDKILDALARRHLPRSLPHDVPPEPILAALRKDKKFHDGSIRFVLLKSPGDAFVSSDITEDDIARQIRLLQET